MRCKKARRLISLYLAPNGSWLTWEDRQALEAHMVVCEPCRRDCQESQAAIGILRERWRISADTAALLEKQQQGEGHRGSAPIIKLSGTSRGVAAWAAAACLVISILGGWTFLSRRAASIGPDRPMASSSVDQPFTVELMGDGGRIVPGALIQTAVGETKALHLNGRHQVLVNAGSRLAIQPIVELGRTGCLVKLTLGEVYVQVEHDGNPFVVQTAQGRAVITGTTFDVKATETGTTLVVAEGSVRFESGAGVIVVASGQQSTVSIGSTLPGIPESCDTSALTAWARVGQGMTQVAGDLRLDGFQRDLLLPLPPWQEAQVDLEGINYRQWVEQKRDWFRQQFPWIFELQEALGKEGTDVSYADLLMQSGDIWRFAYPRAGVGRQIELDPNRLLRAASCYGRDKSWLQQQAFTSWRTADQSASVTGLAPFEQWAKAIEAQTKTCSADMDSQVFLDSLDASSYLANTRTLAMLVIQNESNDIVPQIKDEVLRRLREELHVVARCASLSYGLDSAGPNGGTCESLGRLNALVDAVQDVGEMEKDIREYEKAISRQYCRWNSI